MLLLVLCASSACFSRLRPASSPRLVVLILFFLLCVGCELYLPNYLCLRFPGLEHRQWPDERFPKHIDVIVRHFRMMLFVECRPTRRSHGIVSRHIYTLHVSPATTLLVRRPILDNSVRIQDHDGCLFVDAVGNLLAAKRKQRMWLRRRRACADIQVSWDVLMEILEPFWMAAR